MHVAVTGAFGYSGRYIAKRLLEAGHTVLTLTNSVGRANPFGDRVRACPFHFKEPKRLAESLRGVDALINTYWVRFDHRLFNHDQAVENTKILFAAAREAGVRRIVHVSITNPDISSDLPYFRGKAELEQALQSRWACPGASCGRPSCSAKRMSSSTTSRGRCVISRCSACLDRATTGSSRFTWMIWPLRL